MIFSLKHKNWYSRIRVPSQKLLHVQCKMIIWKICWNIFFQILLIWALDHWHHQKNQIMTMLLWQPQVPWTQWHHSQWWHHQVLNQLRPLEWFTPQVFPWNTEGIHYVHLCLYAVYVRKVGRGILVLMSQVKVSCGTQKVAIKFINFNWRVG